MKTSPTPKWLWLFSLSLICLSYACDEDELSSNDVFTKQSIFGCEHYKTHEFAPSMNVWEVARLNDHYFYATSEALIVKDGMDGDVVLEEEVEITHKFLVHNNKVLICAQGGIYEVDQSLQLTKRSHWNCIDMNLDSDGKVLFTTLGEGGNEPDKIYQLNTDNTVTAYTSSYNWSSCITLKDFVIVDNTIYAQNCSNDLVVFEGNTYSRMYNSTNVFSWLDPNSSAELFFLPYKDDLIVAFKKDGACQLLKYIAESQTWISLKRFTADEQSTAKEIKVATAPIYDAMIEGDELFLATQIGVHRFDLLATTPLQEKDFSIIQDPGLPNQFIFRFYKDTENQMHILTGQHEITRMDCF